MQEQRRAIIVGAGIGGLATAALLAKQGWQVTVVEKNATVGGKASVLTKDGFTFDMGPSWYLMPDVFTHYFALLGENVADILNLRRLDPSYRIFFKGKNMEVDVRSDIARDLPMLEMLEPGCTPHITQYLKEAQEKYRISMDEFLYRNYDSVRSFFSWRVLRSGIRLSILQSMDTYVRRFVKTDAVQKILQYSLVFLGGSPYNTAALYSLMSHIDFTQGVYYPMGGIAEVPLALAKLAERSGTKILCNSPVSRIVTANGKATGVRLADGTELTADVVIVNTDRHHAETQLLDSASREFSEKYWKRRTLAPSAYLLYLGVRGRLPTLTHHNLIFSENWKKNFAEIFDDPRWPTDPSLYICAPSVTDAATAPEDCENIFALVPMASGVEDSPETRAAYRKKILSTIAEVCHIPDLAERIVVAEDFCGSDFAERYNSYRGTALGLAHTIRQTAVWRPGNVSKKVSNLYFVGADTTPGIGMPMCLISAELVYKRIIGDTSTGPLPTPLTETAR